MKTPIFFLVLAGSLALTAKPVSADDSAAPGEGFSASRYEPLWTKSPFAVASAEAVEESPDYILVGFAQVEGVSYASLIERQSQEHFLISTEKPVRGLTLTSITQGHNGSDTYIVMQKDGQPITLKLEQVPVASAPGTVPGEQAASTIPMPSPMTAPLPMPGTGNPSPTAISTRPLIRIHRPQIHLPQMPAQQQQPVQVHPAPPPPQ